MLKLFSYATFSFAIGVFISITTLSYITNNKKPQTLGDTTESTNNKIVFTTTPTVTPTPTVTATATPTPIPTNTPISFSLPTNTPTPTPTTIVAPGIMENWFNQYANQYGVNPQLLKKIAYCESKFNQTAANGIYVGIFQFNEDIWVRYREEMGHDPNPDLRLNANESIKTAAYLISKGKLFFWPNCY